MADGERKMANEQFWQMMGQWGFPRPQEQTFAQQEERPHVDNFGSVENAKKYFSENPNITPAMILDHPYIKMSSTVREYLNNLVPKLIGAEVPNVATTAPGQPSTGATGIRSIDRNNT